MTSDDQPSKAPEAPPVATPSKAVAETMVRFKHNRRERDLRERAYDLTRAYASASGLTLLAQHTVEGVPQYVIHSPPPFQTPITVVERKLVGTRLRSDGWCCVIVLLIVFWPLAWLPCFFMREDVYADVQTTFVPGMNPPPPVVMVHAI